MGRPPHWGSVCLIILYHKYLWIYQLYIPYIFHIYFLDMFHCHPCIFPCVFLNSLWSQEEISPYSKTTFLLLKFKVSRLLYFVNNFMVFIKINVFKAKSGPYGYFIYSITGMIALGTTALERKPKLMQCSSMPKVILIVCRNSLKLGNNNGHLFQ